MPVSIFIMAFACAWHCSVYKPARLPPKLQPRKAELDFCQAAFWPQAWAMDRYCLNEDVEPEAVLTQELVRLALVGC